MIGKNISLTDLAALVCDACKKNDIGEEPVREIHEIRRGKTILRLLSPTDCVKDRLAAFYHWNDSPSLAQAIMVCKHIPVDLREIRRWSINERMKEKFEFFKKALSKQSPK